MSDETSKITQLFLAEDEGTGRVAVGLEPFLVFDVWMNEQLQLLETRWIDRAAPNSRRISPRR